MSARRLLAALLVLPLVVPARTVAAATGVLIVRGESPDLPGGNVLIQSIEDSLRKTAATPIEFYIETIDTGRFAGVSYEEHLAQLLGSKYLDVQLQLVLALSQPAVQFVSRERARLFPAVPVLYGLVDQTMANPIPRGTSAAYVTVDAVGSIRLAQQLYPSMRRVFIAGGASRFDRGWMQVVREQVRQLDPAIPVTFDTDSSIGDLARHVSALTSDTVVFYVSMTRDGAGVPSTPIRALEVLRASAAVPIFGLTNTYVGRGSAGGVVLDFGRHGADLARQAAAMLAGAVPPPIATPAVAMVDSRELQRFAMPVSRLPAGTVVLFRDPTLWEQHSRTVFAGAAVLIGQSALIVALVRAGRRRRRTQVLLLERFRLEQVLSEFSLSIAAAPASGISLALEAALARLSPAIAPDRIVRWRPGDSRDAAWDAARLGRGDVVTIASAFDLPPSVRERLAGPRQPCSALAMPLGPDGAAAGALFWVSPRDDGEWAQNADQLRVMAAVVAAVLQRKQAEIGLLESHQLKGAILDSLPAYIAVLDRDGTIIAVNDGWSRCTVDNGGSAETAGPGASYLRVCRDAVRADVPEASEVLDLIERACRGERTGLPIEYRCDTRFADRWFVMTAEPLRRPEGGAVVTHWEITARKQNEIALRESEDRFRHLADALPVAIWMSDTEGLCTYFNRGWFELTGRTLDEEYGDGWLDSIHAADRGACMDSYLRAFHVREPFRMEFRLRRADGEYRWLVDYGVPRYGTDGAFHGYIGGCLDITESKSAEQALRSLTQRLMTAQDDERRRIARELHDHLSQQLALLAIDLQQLSLHRAQSPEALGTALQEAWRRTTEIASDVHTISHRLHPAKMEALGLVATMRAHCRDISRQSLLVEFLDQDVPSGIPPDRALSLFRVLEEALSNVVRHSGAHSAHVALAGRDGSIMLRIADDGRGFDAAGARDGLGLISIRERVQALDGAISISSTLGRGTVVEVRIPVAADAGDPDAEALAVRADSA